MNYDKMKLIAWKAIEESYPMSLSTLMLVISTHNEMSSYQSYDPQYAMLRLCIQGQFKFNDDDFVNMKRDESHRYYPNAIESFLSHHPHGRGQNEYSLACKVNNVSACRAFEKYFNMKPYKIGARRAVIGVEYYLNRHCRIRITGYQLERKVILCVMEEYNTEKKEWIKTKHPTFDNKQWREFVKENNRFKNY